MLLADFAKGELKINLTLNIIRQESFSFSKKLSAALFNPSCANHNWNDSI